MTKSQTDRLHRHGWLPIHFPGSLLTDTELETLHSSAAIVTETRDGRAVIPPQHLAASRLALTAAAVSFVHGVQLLWSPIPGRTDAVRVCAIIEDRSEGNLRSALEA